ncbi:MAG: L,D-transpeptidase, partial [Chloroflexales bacterium]|nr:L,D-transpeptidase [Chloroflexales bacterium]
MSDPQTPETPPPAPDSPIAPPAPEPAPYEYAAQPGPPAYQGLAEPAPRGRRRLLILIAAALAAFVACSVVALVSIVLLTPAVRNRIPFLAARAGSGPPPEAPNKFVAQPGGRVSISDDFSGWQYFELPFSAFNRKEIGNGAPNDGFGLTEVHGWALGSITTPAPQTWYVDNATVYGTAPVKPPIAGGAKWIDVNLSRQRLTAYQGNTAVFSALISGGLPRTPTVVGRFKVYTKLTSTRMRGPGYDLPNVPYTMYFYRGYA